MTTQPHECGTNGELKPSAQYICELAAWGKRLENERDHALDDLKAEIANHREDVAALKALRETAAEQSRVHVEMHNRIMELSTEVIRLKFSHA